MIKRFANFQNNGTIAITNRIAAPIQGTWIGGTDDNILIAKGIVRPQLRNPRTGEYEPEMYNIEAGFGKEVKGPGRMFKLGEIGAQKCRLALQTVIFSAADPAALLNHDSKRFETKTALDRLSRDNKVKVEAGVSPALLLDQLSVGDMFTRLEVQGIRATVYGSYLVPENASKWAEIAPAKMHEQFAKLGYTTDTALGEFSCFMLLRASAASLAKQLGVEPHELIGKIFCVHRDPALPDGTSLFASLYLGVLEWTNGCKNENGVIFHPKDRYWVSGGGDFDGDAAAIYVPTTYLLPRGAVPRPDYKAKGKKIYASTDIAQQMIEAASSTVARRLGPTILAAMRLIERDLADEHLLGILAGVAQASVQSKKHAVNTEVVEDQFRMIVEQVRMHSAERPFFTDFLNRLKNTGGVDNKTRAWTDLIDAITAGTWEDGTAFEKALANRALTLNQLFADTEFFRNQKDARLPAAMMEAARAACSTQAASAMKALALDYRTLAVNLSEATGTEEIEDEDLREGYRSEIVERLRTLRGAFELASITGNIGGEQFIVEEAQTALISWGPPRLSVRFVPAELFTRFGAQTSRMITMICGTGWKNGVYKVADLKPIPAVSAEFKRFVGDHLEVNLEVIRESPNSSRCCLTLI